MIFVTVGTQLAFPRLIQAVDRWAESHPDTEVFAQVGPSNELAKHFTCKPFIGPVELENLVKRCELVVAHAGMGSILTALKYRKPILVLPREAKSGEHRNDHQIATARWLEGRPNIFVAWSDSELIDMLGNVSASATAEHISDWASPQLIGALSSFINK